MLPAITGVTMLDAFDVYTGDPRGHESERLAIGVVYAIRNSGYSRRA